MAVDDDSALVRQMNRGYFGLVDRMLLHVILVLVMYVQVITVNQVFTAEQVAPLENLVTVAGVGIGLHGVMIVLLTVWTGAPVIRALWDLSLGYYERGEST